MISVRVRRDVYDSWGRMVGDSGFSLYAFVENLLEELVTKRSIQIVGSRDLDMRLSNLTFRVE